MCRNKKNISVPRTRATPYGKNEETAHIRLKSLSNIRTTRMQKRMFEESWLGQALGVVPFADRTRYLQIW
jgi:hypothetical protein